MKTCKLYIWSKKLDSRPSLNVKDRLAVEKCSWEVGKRLFKDVFL